MLSANNSPCMECEKPTCPGICDKLRAAMGEIDTHRAQHTITWNGVERTVDEWAEILGVSRSTLYRKLDQNVDIESMFNNLASARSGKSKLPPGCLEETYIRLSTMHLDYLLFWNRLNNTDSSAGMVVKYGAIKTSPTHHTSSTVEQRAMPELGLSDEALNRREWIACVLDVLARARKRNNQTPFPGDQMRAQMLEWRAIEGLTMKRICERIQEDYPVQNNRYTYTPMRIRRFMEPIVIDVAREALKRKLIRGTQK